LGTICGRCDRLGARVQPVNGFAELFTRENANKLNRQTISSSGDQSSFQLKSNQASVNSLNSSANADQQYPPDLSGYVSDHAGYVIDTGNAGNVSNSGSLDNSRNANSVHSSEHSSKKTDRIGLLLNNPHNPSGELYCRDRILDLLPHYQLVAIDEAFMDFLPDEQSHSLIDQVENYPNLVILRSLTKFYALPGLRIGYAIAHPDRLAKWQQWRDPWSVNWVAQQAAIASLADTAHRHKTWQWLPEARSQLFKGLNSIPGLTPQPGAANYLLVKSDYSVLDLRNRLLQQARILIRDCLSFPELGDRYFRVCVRTRSENERLITALRQIIT
jgi:aspartate/methionine/tyrosine aminotransferase